MTAVASAGDAREKRDEELESAFVYSVLAESEHDPRARKLFGELAAAARGQAAIWAESAPGATAFQPSFRARLVARLARRFGARRLRPVLAAMKVRGLSLWAPVPISEHPLPAVLSHEAGRHRSAKHGSNLRAAVFGVSDGIVSNASLILGVSGASADTHMLAVAGFAGLLAGASSMAAGEYASMRSQRELFEYQIGLERDELAQYPEEEEAEIALIYEARGLSRIEAATLARKLMADPETALDTLARDELGLDPSSLSSPWSAAAYSFLAFAIGAALPLVPLFLAAPSRAIVYSATAAFVALFVVGATLSLFTGRSALWSGARLALLGTAAAAATWSIGRWFGVAVG
ncbi:MAG TPA: VIT1/CCC1 transporter family protein [Planctomycetota bacterium]|nr:VIT1/CCC1 transporter family protein [Planctomycetota bacterium]